MGKAGAPFGNRNAEKWTFRKSIELFNKAIEMANEKSYQQIPVSGGMPIKKEQGFKYDFIGEIASELGLYKEIFTNLVNRFPSLKKKHNLLITKLESNCYYNGKNGNIKEASSIMNLKSNHGWTDRKDITTKGKKISEKNNINVRFIK